MAIIVVWFLAPAALRYAGCSLEKAALLGDSYGALNALFSGLALAGVVYAIRLQTSQLQVQRDELQLQRVEIEESRKELKRAADAHEASLRTFAEQLAASRDTASINALSTLIDVETRKLEQYRHDQPAGGWHIESFNIRRVYIAQLKAILEKHGIAARPSPPEANGEHAPTAAPK